MLVFSNRYNTKDGFMHRYEGSINDSSSHPLADEEDDGLLEDKFSIAYQLDREFGYASTIILLFHR